LLTWIIVYTNMLIFCVLKCLLCRNTY